MVTIWGRLYRLIARTAKFEAADLRTAHAETTFGQVCEAAARRGSLVLAATALRELAVVAGVIGLAWLGRLGHPRLPRGAFSPREFRVAVRSLLRSHRGYVVFATVVLAVSVGANLVVFTVVNALWIRPLPFPEADRLVTIPQSTYANLEGPQTRMFEGGVAGQVLTVDTRQGLTPRIAISGVSRDLEILGVTPNYFRLLGLTARGRDFTPDDDREGAEPVAIISDRVWAREFGRRTDVIGAVLPAEPFPIRVIGVAPEGFAGARRGERADMWVPTSVVGRLAPAGFEGEALALLVFGRLGAGQTVAMMDQRFRDLMRPQDREWLLANSPGWEATPVVVPLDDVFGTPDTRTFMVSEGDAALIVAGMALLVLLAGCATIAALVLVHYERRRAELALRAALGAARGRLVLELLRDLLLIAAAGGAAGMAVAYLGVRLLPGLSLPGGVDIGRLDLSIDWRVCAVAVAATLATLLAAATRPIIRTTHLRLAAELVAGAASTTLASQRARQVLLALQVCATTVVLVSAGLFVRAVSDGFGSAPGFDVDRTVFASVQEGTPFGSGTGGSPRPLIAERAARLMPMLLGLPGVDGVAEGVAPIGPDARIARALTIRVGEREHDILFGRLRGSPELLATLGVPILAGRHLTAADAADSPEPAVITRSLAERLWPHGNALGQVFQLPQLRGASGSVVVGIAGDLAFGSLAASNSGVIVTAGPGNSAIVSSFVVRTDQPEMVAREIERTVEGQVVKATTGREVLARDLGRQRLGAWFFSGFGLAALLLGVGGAFGLVAYLAESQRREFGVRLALGADMGHLVRRGLVAALAPVSLGVVAGLVVAGGVSQVFTSLLAGISALDPVTYLLVAAAVLGFATLAALAAAWRLRHTTPSDALRTT
jgi:predicted permease